MRNKTITAVLCAVIMLSVIIPAQATDLPIDINAIKNQTGYDDAITANFKIDVLTTNSSKVSETIAEHKRQKSAQTASELFETAHEIKEVELSEEIKNTAGNAGLFTHPINSSNLTKAKEENTISIWMIILLLTVCSAIGFVWSFISRRRRTDDVH